MLWYSIVLNKSINDGLRGWTASDWGQNKFLELLTLWTTTTPSFIGISLMPMEMAYTMYSLTASEAAAVIQKLLSEFYQPCCGIQLYCLRQLMMASEVEQPQIEVRTSEFCSWPRGQQPLKVSSWLAKRQQSYSNLGSLGSRFWRRREKWMSGQSGQLIFRERQKL